MSWMLKNLVALLVFLVLGLNSVLAAENGCSAILDAIIPVSHHFEFDSPKWNQIVPELSTKILAAYEKVRRSASRDRNSLFYFKGDLNRFKGRIYQMYFLESSHSLVKQYGGRVRDSTLSQTMIWPNHPRPSQTSVVQFFYIDHLFFNSLNLRIQKPLPAVQIESAMAYEILGALAEARLKEFK